MVKLSAVYLGELRCEITHSPSGVKFLTDAPLDNNGRAESFSPSDSVAGALGACILTIMGIAARARGLDMTGATITVDKHMKAEPYRQISRLDVAIEMPGHLTEKDVELLWRSAEHCPVRESLNPSIEVNVSISRK